jgi:hypothetical protein
MTSLNMSFTNMIPELAAISGKKARRLDARWENRYITFVDGKLMIMGNEPDNLFHPITIAAEDVLSSDWVFID